MRKIIAGIILSTTVLTAACGKSKASLADMQKLKDEACACKDKACADKVSKKADKMFTDDAIKSAGDKGMEVAFGLAACLAKNQ